MTLCIGDVVFNIGNPAFEGIPAGTRAAMALLEAAAVRSSGFVTLPPSSLAPAAQ